MTGQDIKMLHGCGLSFGRQARAMSIPKSTLANKASKGRGKPSRLASKPKQAALWEWVRMLKEIKPTWGIRRVRAWIRKALMIPIGTLKADWLLVEECGTFAEAKGLVTRAVSEYNQSTRIHP